MKRAIIHIGNLKTGTTAIQAVLLSLRPELQQRGIILPNVDRTKRAHYEFATEMALPREKADRLRRTLEEIATVPAGSTILLSAETLMYVPAEWLKSELSAVGVTDFRILCYLRPHISMATSFYLHNLKIGYFRGPVSSHLELIGGEPIQFLDVVRRYAEVFGAYNAECREFHRSVLAEGSVVNDFWYAAGLPTDLRAKALETETISNPSPSAELALLLRACSNFLFDQAPPEHRQTNNEPGVPPGEIRMATKRLFQTLARRADVLPATRFQLPLVVQEALKARFEEERRAFATTWFRQPPSTSWLEERIEAQEPLRALPAKPVLRAIHNVAVRLREAGLAYAPDALDAFANRLPSHPAGDKGKISCEALAATFGLAPEEPPDPGELAGFLCSPRYAEQPV